MTIKSRPAAKGPAPRRPRSSRKSGPSGGGLGPFIGPLGKALALVALGVFALVILSQLGGPLQMISSSLATWFADTLGWAILVPLILIGVLTWFLRTHHERLLLTHWNQTLGTVLIGMAAMGILGLVGAGGELGRFVAGDGLTGGWLRVFVLTVIGVFALWPKTTASTARQAATTAARISSELPQAAAAIRARVPRPSPKQPRTESDTDDDGADEADDDAEALEPETTAEPTVVLDVAVEPEPEPEPEPVGLVASRPDRLWRLPPMSLLDNNTKAAFSEADNQKRARLIEDTLRHFDVDAKVIQINQGPAVTQFGIEPGWDVKTREIRERDADGKLKLDRDGNPIVRTEEVGRTRVPVRRITALANDLALALAAPTIRIEAPVPGKAMLGIEVPNQTTTVVAMRSVIESPPFQKLTAKTKLPIALGKSVEGESAVFDLAKAPHLLIAGATGSGKSVCINSIITCLLMHCDPTDVRLLMVDPKRVELAAFSGIPHLLSPIIVENDQVVAALRWVTKEMDERYKRFAEAAARNIDAYNQKPPDGRKLPYLVVVIDELADVMMASPFEVERTLVRLAQLARAAGIHVIIATQRPSVDVVTGLIKANFPTRIAFAVTSQVDSRTILDMAGAEKLLGRGDMLYMATDAAKPRRLQGVYLSDAEIDRVVRFWREQKAEGLDVKQVTHEIEELADPEESPGGGRKVDALYEQAKAIAEAKGSISTSYLQRRLSIGYNRAARLVEQLEEEGLISPSDDGKTREFRPSGMSAASPPTSPATAKPDSNEDDDSLPF